MEIKPSNTQLKTSTPIFITNPQYMYLNPNYRKWKIKPLTSQAWMIQDAPTKPQIHACSCSSSSSSSSSSPNPLFLSSFYVRILLLEKERKQRKGFYKVVSLLTSSLALVWLGVL